MKRLLHVIADYRPISQEFGEILQRIWAQNWDLDLVVVPTALPAFPSSVVMWIDGFGNIKTSVRRSASPWREGEKVHVEINGKRVTALVTGGVFSVDEGELAWSVGSSGHGDPFMEVFLRGGSVADLFEHPHPGAEVVVTR